MLETYYHHFSSCLFLIGYVFNIPSGPDKIILKLPPYS